MDSTYYLNVTYVRSKEKNVYNLFHILDPLPPHAKEQYGFTDFAVTLNDMVPSMVDFLPPTDTRFRPDQRRDFRTTLIIRIYIR